MIIKTTLNIHKDILEEITAASQILNLSRTDLIIKLLKMVMAKDTDKATINRSVKYQGACDKTLWRRFHIKLDAGDYEYFLDLRKFLKMSVSHLVAYAVKNYIKELLNKGSGDNYHFINYIFNTDIKDGIRYWQIIWGFPANVEEFYPKIT